VGVPSAFIARTLGFNELIQAGAPSVSAPTPAATVPAVDHVKTGLDALVEQQFGPLAGKRVGIITNHSGQTRDRQRNIDVIHKSGTVHLAAIFTPEHGLAGLRDDPNISSSVDTATGVPIRSLFNGPTRRMTPDMLEGIDALVYDIQDIGARFYTFITTLGYGLEAAAQARIPYFVLDRPNPINGVAVEGPLLDDKYVSFVGYARIPIRHGMTIGELARFYNGEKKLGADLHVIPMEGWKRRMWFDETGLEWINPSPAIRNLTEAILYPGACLLESKQVSVGRGTDTPFEIIGAPWFRAFEAADYLNHINLPGVSFMPCRFRPNAYLFKDQDCEGLDIQVLDRNAYDSVRVGLELLHITLKLHPGRFDIGGIMRLLGNDEAEERLKRGETGSEVSQALQANLAEFRTTREKYLTYS
jgi:uncharacterized protein YbbC (DUF1343 family)